MDFEIKPVSVPSSCTQKQPVQMEAVYDWPMDKSGGSTSSHCPDTILAPDAINSGNTDRCGLFTSTEHLNKLCRNIWFLFKKLKRVFASIEFQNLTVQFVIKGLYLNIETVSCRLMQRMAKMEIRSNLKKMGQLFQL